MLNHFSKIILFLFLFHQTASASKNVPVTNVKEGFESICLVDSISYLPVQYSFNTFEQVFKLPDSCFINHNSDHLAIDFFQPGRWFQFRLFNDNDFEKEIFIEIINPNIEDLQLYFLDDNGNIIQKLNGNMYPFASREVYSNYPVFKISLHKKELKNLYIYANNSGISWAFPIFVWEGMSFGKQAYKSHFIPSLFLGFVLLVIIINFYLLIQKRRRIVISYFLYVLSLTMVQLNIDGVAFELFYPNTPSIYHNFFSFFALLSMIFNLRFFQEYLNTKLFIPKYNKVLNYFQFICILMVPFSFFDVTNYPLIYIESIISILLTGIILYGAIRMTRYNKINSIYYLVGYSIITTGVVIYVLTQLGVVDGYLFGSYAFKIGTAGEITVLTMAIIQSFQREQMKTKELAMQRLRKIHLLTEKANAELEAKVAERTKELEAKQQLVKKINTNLSQAKEQLERKNRDIIDSINYAKKIQTTILPPTTLIDKILNQYFILYKPKDIVSGDFYWVGNKNGKAIFSVIDCTGHGVPGALMSMIGYDQLNIIIYELGIIEPAKILDKLNDMINQKLRSGDQENHLRDGMDMSICTFDEKTGILEFAGANNPIYLIRDNSLIPYKADNKPIGSYLPDLKRQKQFTNHSLEIQKNDMIYLFSDGYADQFGGPKEKKFKQNAFKQLLTSIANNDMNNQQSILDSTIVTWQGELEQIDDMCILGVKF